MSGLCARCVYKNVCGQPARTVPCEGRKTKSQCERCVICGKPIFGKGNNPAPFMFKGECCDVCNFNVVIPARMAAAKGSNAKQF